MSERKRKKGHEQPAEGDQGNMTTHTRETPPESPPTPLKKPSGRQIAMFRQQAREALPEGPLEAQAKKADELARAAGFEMTTAPEKMRLREKAPSTPVAERGPTVEQLLRLASRAHDEPGGLEALAARVAEVEAMIADAGGTLAALKVCVEALRRLKDA